MTTPSTRCGFVAIIGAPNAGKSTLLNTLVGSKVAIATHKVQTTRMPIRGIKNFAHTQCVFIDTPGIHNASGNRLNQAMVQSAWQSAADADVAVLLLDAQKNLGGQGLAILQRLVQEGRPFWVALNKIDGLSHAVLLPKMQAIGAAAGKLLLGCFAISARSGDGVTAMFKQLAETMPLGPWLYPDDSPTDQTLPVRLAELTREQLLIFFHDEIPYDLQVVTTDIAKGERGGLIVQQQVVVVKAAHRQIILGRGGQAIKNIGTRARQQMQKVLGQGVQLFLQVTVDPKWMGRDETLRHMGLPTK